jgi:hypothetical protein
MDKLSGLAHKLGGGSSSHGSSNQAAGNEDYVDKGEYHDEQITFIF